MDYPSSRITYIYALTGSDHIDVKYIGKSNDPKGRLKQHIYNAKKAKIPTYKQIAEVYETYRAKCSKTTAEERENNLAKGCITPADGTTKRC